MKKYRCIILDHDDTSVKSTPEVHYPAFLITLDSLRNGQTVSYEKFINYMFDPGFYATCENIYNFTPREMEIEQAQWISYSESHSPDFYEGIPEFIKRQKESGGLVCVVSHNRREFILRDYAAAGVPAPDMIFGSELGREFQKPAPYPVLKIMETYSLSPSDILVIDDLKPGYDMAMAAGVDFIYAGWSATRIPPIEAFMREHGAVIMDSPCELTSDE